MVKVYEGLFDITCVCFSDVFDDKIMKFEIDRIFARYLDTIHGNSKDLGNLGPHIRI